MISLCTVLSVIITFQSYLPLTESIKCYKCSFVTRIMYQKDPTPLCSDFDYSEPYVIDCPYSTYCMKKTYQLKLNTKIINATVRGCAAQTNTIQEYRDGSWQKRIFMEEPYQEGCSEVDDKGQKSTDGMYCYCKWDLCNSASTLSDALTVMFSLVLACTVVRYL